MAAPRSAPRASPHTARLCHACMRCVRAARARLIHPAPLWKRSTCLHMRPLSCDISPSCSAEHDPLRCQPTRGEPLLSLKRSLAPIATSLRSAHQQPGPPISSATAWPQPSRNLHPRSDPSSSAPRPQPAAERSPNSPRPRPKTACEPSRLYLRHNPNQHPHLAPPKILTNTLTQTGDATRARLRRHIPSASILTYRVRVRVS